MLFKANELVEDKRLNMRGGDGEVTMMQLPVEGKPGKVRMAAYITIPVGASIGEHAHVGETELFYFISGLGEVNDAGEIRAVFPGDILSTGNGASHAVKNIGDVDLVMAAVIVLD